MTDRVGSLGENEAFTRDAAAMDFEQGPPLPNLVDVVDHGDRMSARTDGPIDILVPYERT